LADNELNKRWEAIFKKPKCPICGSKEYTQHQSVQHNQEVGYKKCNECHANFDLG
jgi:transposase-like protein